MKKHTVTATVFRLILYLILLFLPLILVWLLIPRSGYDFLTEMGKSAALLAIGLIILQPVLSARLKAVERPIGLDMIFHFHKAMPLIALILLLCHPILLSMGAGSWELLTSWQLPWYILLGKATLILLLVNVIISLWRKKISMGYQSWKTMHNVAGLLIVLGAFLHSWQTGDDIQVAGMQALWIVLLVGVLGFYVYHKLIRPLMLKRKPYRVTRVKAETRGVTTLRFEPIVQQTAYDHLPGQFHFIRLFRGRGLPREEHHFTISSAPHHRGFLESTIKASGDFTSTIDRTKEGDEAAIQGPFGRFSYVLHPERKNLVFIAGGIGITPIMSMIRDMAGKTDQGYRAVLLYANQTEQDIVFRQELEELARNQETDLDIRYFLAHPPEGWEGETGHITREKIRQYCPEPKEQDFYICGPPPMMKNIIKHLKSMKVKNGQIFFERFSL